MHEKCRPNCESLIKQGVALTGRNTTGPLSRAAPGELPCIGSGPCALQRTIDVPCTLPLSLQKSGTRRDFAVCFRQ